MLNITSMTNKIIELWKSGLPFNAITEEVEMQQVEVIAVLRKHNLVKETQSIEKQFIIANDICMPQKEIQDLLCMSDSQFSQVLAELNIKKRKTITELSETTVIARTQRIINEKLNYPFSQIPRQITNKDFTKNDSYDLIKYATQNKKTHSIFKNFSAVAYLVCIAYPNEFQPFQFKHSKGSYFKDKRFGQKRLIDAVRWVIYKKGYTPEHLTKIGQDEKFLTTQDLRYYGVGPNYFRLHFPDKKTFINTVLKSYSEYQENTSKRPTNSQLKKKLNCAGRNTNVCDYPNCSFSGKLEFHHIIPFSDRSQFRFDINRVENLMCLCPNHHALASTLSLKELDLKTPATWIPTVIQFLKQEELN